MDAGGLAHMSQPNFSAPNGLAMANSGLASRRGGAQNIKPLSFDTLRNAADQDNGAPTPRTSRSHLLAGLRTAPKSATAATFSAAGSNMSPVNQPRNRNSMAPGGYGNDHMYNGPKTSLPRYGQQQTQGFRNNNMAYAAQQFTPDQILAPPQIEIEDPVQDQADPMYAQLVATNMYLAQQQQALQQQLLSVQAAQQQFQNMNLGRAQPMQQQQQLYQTMVQQQQLRNLQQQMMMSSGIPQGNIYTMVDPMTGQQTYYVDQNVPQINTQFEQYNQGFQTQQPLSAGAPRLQVSPPPAEGMGVQRNTSPPRRFDSPTEQPAPLPPPSANAFRRGHKKSASNANNTSLSVSTMDAVPKSAGPKTANFPLTPMTGSYGPGQARAGEHPIRQPRGPPSFDELVTKPTSKHEGSKNFVARTRRSAVHNLTRAGISRRQVATTGSSGSISPISEDAEELATPLTDDDSDSGRSGSGSLVGDDVECSLPSSRSSTGSWGAIGSDRPISRSKERQSVESFLGASDDLSGSFAAVFKSAVQTPTPESTGNRKAPRLVLTSAEKRKNAVA